MNRRDRGIVAAILAASLTAGLATVHFSLDKAKENQSIAMDRATSNLGGLQLETDIPADELQPEVPQQPEGGVELPPPFAPEPVVDDKSGPGEPGFRDEENTAQSAEEKIATLLDALESGNFSSIEVLRQLGLLDDNARPTMDSTELTIYSFTEWMQNESMDALVAQAAEQGAQAVADGMSSADNAQLRAFAKSQGPANYQAARNGLAETAMELSMEYLRCREVLALHTQVLEVVRGLEQVVSGQVTENDVETAPVEADDTQEKVDVPTAAQEAVTRMLEQLTADVEQAKKDLDVAARAVLQAIGNPADAQLVFLDDLVLDTSVGTEIEFKTAVQQAVDNRNELKKAAYDIVRAESDLTQLRYQYPPGAPEVLEQQACLSAAQAEILVLNDQIQEEIRERVAELEQLSEQLGQTPVQPNVSVYEVSEDTAVIAERLLGEWVLYRDDQLRWIETVAELNLKVLQFKHAIGAGTVSVEITG